MKLQINKQELREFLLYSSMEQLNEYIYHVHPADILDVLHDNKEKTLLILSKLPISMVAQVIDEANNDEKFYLLNKFPEDKQKEIVKEMSSDELVDLIGHLNEEASNKILAKVPKEDVEDLRQLLSYEPQSAGGVMATEFIRVSENMTVKDTFKYLQKTVDDVESAYYIYVLDEDDTLKGVVSLKEIVINNFNTPISQIMNTQIITIPFDMDQEDVAHKFEKYGFSTMPVVDKNDKMLGIITVDDIMEILKDETTEDFHRLGGIDEGERVDSTVKQSVKSRLPWLLVNLVTAILASSVVSLFEGTISKVVVLATFMPIVAGMGGNAGTQTLTIVVRGLALGELTSKNSKIVLFKEIGVGIVTGVVIGIVVALLALVWEGNPVLGLVIGIAMILNMIAATVSGFIVPLVLKKLKVDPALASAVFVTTVTDVLGFFFFLGLASVFLKYLV